MRLPTILIISIICFLRCDGESKVFRSRRIGTEGQVISRMLSDYDPSTRPPVRDSADHSAILVISNIYINRVRWNDDRAEVDLYLRQQWEDQRLQYEVDTREGIEEISIPANRKIWVPDTYFSSGNEVGKSDKKRVMVEPSGYVRSSEQRTIEVPISYGSSFPFLNTKSFHLRLASYSYPLEDVVYLWANSPPHVNPVEVAPELLSGQFTFEEASAGDCVGNYTVGMYSCIDVTVTFSTSTVSALCSWFLPSLFLLVTSWLHFWVHGSWSVPRTISASLPFFIFAALFVFRSDIVSASQGAGCWLAFCLVLTFLSLFEYFLVICCGIRRSIRYSNGGHPEDHPLGHPLGAAKEQAVEISYDTRCASFRNNNGLDIIARILFPVITIVFLIIYFIFLI